MKENWISTNKHILEGGIPLEKMTIINARSIGKSYYMSQMIYFEEMRKELERKRIDDRDKKIDEILK